MWFGFGMAAILAAGIFGALSAPLSNGVFRNTVLGFGYFLVCVMGFSLAEMGMLRYRADRTRADMLKGRPGAGREPLPPGAAGLPRRSDFWVMLGIAVAVFVVLLAAATHSASQ